MNQDARFLVCFFKTEFILNLVVSIAHLVYVLTQKKCALCNFSLAVIYFLHRNWYFDLNLLLKIVKWTTECI